MSRSQPGAPGAHGNSKTGQDIELALENTSSQTLRGLHSMDSNRSGYNPYNAVRAVTGNGNGAGTTGVHRLDDIRRLSEWIRTKRDLDRAQEKKKKKK